MLEPAPKGDVVTALSDASGVSVTPLADGSYEGAAVGQPLRRFVFKATVSRKWLWRFATWYNVPIEAFYQSYPLGLRLTIPSTPSRREVMQRNVPLPAATAGFVGEPGRTVEAQR